jgi:HlyD family secretion protein
VVGGAVLGLLVWTYLPAPAEVDLAQVERGPMMVTIDHEGKTRVRERYVVSAPLSGRLVRIEHRPGDAIERDRTLLAVIEPVDPSLLDVRQRSEALARVDAAEAGCLQAQSQLERAQNVWLQAHNDLERDTKLRSQGHISREEYEATWSREQVAAAEQRSAEFAVRIAEFELDQARAALFHTRGVSSGESEPFRFEVPAPIDGVVLRVHQESATVVSPGTPLIEVGDPTDLECEVDVLSTDAVQIQPGQRVLLERWGGGRSLEGRVRVREPSGFTKISALGVEEQRVNIIIDLLDPRERRPTLGDGYRVEARIVVWEGRDVLKVPAGALFQSKNGWSVFRERDGHAWLQIVDVGRTNGLETEVLAGLDMGDHVILHPSDRVQNGVAIQPR